MPPFDISDYIDTERDIEKKKNRAKRKENKTKENKNNNNHGVGSVTEDLTDHITCCQLINRHFLLYEFNRI